MNGISKTQYNADFIDKLIYKGEFEMSKINKYIVIFNREISIDDDVILYIKQDVNRPNNPTDDEIIKDYIYKNYGHTNYEAEELNSLEEEII